MNALFSRFTSLVLRLPSYFLVALTGAILFIPFLGRAHLFDWDEINFAEAAREMLVTGDYSRVMIDFRPFWEKPPFFFWMQALSMKLFGINEFAARFPNAVCGVITLCLIFYLGKKYFDKTFGWLWVLAYAGSFLTHMYFKSGIIDPWFNLFIFSGIIFLAHPQDGKPSLLRFLLSGFCIGMGVLTKGPVALLVFLLTVVVFSFLSKTKIFSWKGAMVFLFSMLFVSSAWFAVDFLKHGTFFLREFIRYQLQLFQTGVAGHGGPVYYHIPVLLLGCFPASVFALSGFFNKHQSAQQQKGFRLLMLALFFVVLILFSIVKTKIVHYSSLCYLPLTFLAALEIYFRSKNGSRFSKFQTALLLFFGMLFGMAASLLPYVGLSPGLIKPYIKDAFALANLEAQADWHPAQIVFGFFYWLLVMIAVFRIAKGRLLHGAVLLFLASCFLTQVVLFSFLPRVERYTQGAAVDFYKSLQGKNVYVSPLGFKSYAHLFYAQKLPQSDSMSYQKDWLLHGAIEKPAYFVCKINRANEYSALPQLEEIGRKNGFVFFKREPSQSLR